MSRPLVIPIWKKAPFIRLLLPLVVGILLQWYLKIPVAAVIVGAISFSIAYLLFFLFPTAIQFKLQSLQAVILNLLIVSVGLCITWQKDVQHSNHWFGQYYQDSDYLLVRINEPLIEKLLAETPKTVPSEASDTLTFAVVEAELGIVHA